MEFRELTLGEREKLERCFAASGFRGSTYCFGLNYIWRKQTNPHVAYSNGSAILRFGRDGDYSYAYPAGEGDGEAALRELVDDTSREGLPLKISAEESGAEVLRRVYGERFNIIPDRAFYDYIYAQDKLSTLSGKKYHSKRNHVSRFKSGDWSYEEITQENLEECRVMSEDWCRMYGCSSNKSLRDESCAVRQAFENFFTLGLKGGLLRKDGRIVAFSMGEPMLKDQFITHVEKAYHEVEGAYAAMNQEFSSRAAAGYQYINREDDTGDEGLRKAKLSYKPEILLEKFTATAVKQETVDTSPVRGSTCETVIAAGEMAIAASKVSCRR